MKFFDKFGLLCVHLLLVLVPLHHIVSASGYIYYREILSGSAGLCAVGLMIGGRRFGPRGMLTMALVFFSIGFVVVMSGIDTGEKLSPGAANLEASTQLSEGNVNETLYVLRMFVLYVPVCAFLAVTRLWPSRLRRLCTTIALMGPVAILGYLYFYQVATIGTLALLPSLAGAGLQYNSFVPHLTYSIIASLYLYFESPGWLGRAVQSSLLLSVFLYIFVSTSRQSLLFCFSAVVVFYYATRVSRHSRRTYMAAALVVAAMVLISWVTSGQEVGQKLLDQLSLAGYSDNTGRVAAWKESLGSLTVGQWVLGVGLTSIITSGPHTDFIRWIQRIGVPGMVLVELPFVTAFFDSLGTLRRRRCALNALSFLGVAFTLYHSLFGYPREDAYQMLYCWLGLGLYIRLRDGSESGRPSVTAA